MYICVYKIIVKRHNSHISKFSLLDRRGWIEHEFLLVAALLSVVGIFFHTLPES